MSYNEAEQDRQRDPGLDGLDCWPVERDPQEGKFDPNDPDCGCLKGVQQCDYHRKAAQGPPDLARPRLRPNRATRYEVTATHEDGRRFVVGFTHRLSRAGVLALMRLYAEEIIDACSITDEDIVFWRTKPRPGAEVAGWTLTFTGRTEREAFYSPHRPAAHPRREA